jgi:hypothetical protein
VLLIQDIFIDIEDPTSMKEKRYMKQAFSEANQRKMKKGVMERNISTISS